MLIKPGNHTKQQNKKKTTVQMQQKSTKSSINIHTVISQYLFTTADKM